MAFPVIKPTDPSGLKVAGLAVMASDTGRFLLLQRSVSENDPASGTWEFPGGHIEEGETPLVAAKREWREETGSSLPNGTTLSAWESGIYRGHIYVIPQESQVQLNKTGPSRKYLNPDDPDQDNIEVAAWFREDQLVNSPIFRQELRDSWSSVRSAISVAKNATSKVAGWGQNQKDLGGAEMPCSTLVKQANLGRVAVGVAKKALPWLGLGAASAAGTELEYRGYNPLLSRGSDVVVGPDGNSTEVPRWGRPLYDADNPRHAERAASTLVNAFSLKSIPSAVRNVSKSSWGGPRALASVGAVVGSTPLIRQGMESAEIVNNLTSAGRKLSNEANTLTGGPLSELSESIKRLASQADTISGTTENLIKGDPSKGTQSLDELAKSVRDSLQGVTTIPDKVKQVDWDKLSKGVSSVGNIGSYAYGGVLGALLANALSETEDSKMPREERQAVRRANRLKLLGLTAGGSVLGRVLKGYVDRQFTGLVKPKT